MTSKRAAPVWLKAIWEQRSIAHGYDLAFGLEQQKAAETALRDEIVRLSADRPSSK